MPYGIDNDEFAGELEDLQADIGQELRPSLFDEVRRILRLNHYSIRTEEAYLGWIRRFIERMMAIRADGARDLETFLSRLAWWQVGQYPNQAWQQSVPVSDGFGAVD